MERALQRGPEPPDVFDFLNACAASGQRPTEREQREIEVKRAVKDSKRSAPALRRKLLQARERKRTLQAEEAQLRERGVRLGRDLGGVHQVGSQVGAGTAGSNQASMGQQLLAQDQGRLTRIARDVAALEGEERQLERLLGQRSEGKKMFKF